MDMIKSWIKSIDTKDEHNRTFAGIMTTLFLYFCVAPFFGWVGSLVEFVIFFLLPAMRAFLMFMTGDAGFRFRVKNTNKLIVQRLSPEKSMLAVYFTLAFIKLMSFILFILSYLPFLTTAAWFWDCLLFIMAIIIQIPVEFLNHVFGVLKRSTPIIGSYFDITLEGTLMDYLVYYLRQRLGENVLTALNAIDDVIEKYDTSGSPDLTDQEKQNFYNALEILRVNPTVVEKIKDMDANKFDQFIAAIGAKIGQIVSTVIVDMFTGNTNITNVIYELINNIDKKLN